MGLKQQIDIDLKHALLSGDKIKITTLRGIKSTILNEEIAHNARENGLSDEAIVQCLKKEAKKRVEAAELYEKAGSQERASQEKAEKRIIEAYLPAAMSEAEITQLVEIAITEESEITPATMGKLIGKVKAATQGAADGSVIARIVKDKLQDRG
jgi:uncharacterized protein YqeY